MVKLQFYIGLNDGYGPHKVGIFLKFVSAVCVKGLQQFFNLPEMPYVALVKMLDSLFFASLNTFDIVVNNQETLISESLFYSAH